jgi:acyl-CoA oxidase
LFNQQIKAFAASSQHSNLLPALRRCGVLYALHCVQERLSVLLELGHLTGQQSQAIRSAFLDACADLRTDAVPLVDAWAFPDFVIKAPIGRYDGDIYSSKWFRLFCLTE